jgi:FkbM family methyltransferase
VINPFVQEWLSENTPSMNMSPRIPVQLPEQFAQAGEDLIVLSLLYRLNYLSTASHKSSFSLENVRYLEIGANHPVGTSSTYLLYKKGARGVLVEPNPDLVEMLKEFRRGDQVFGVACVDDDADFVDLHTSEASELSSMIIASPMRWSSQFKITGSIRVPALNINELAQKFWNMHSEGLNTYLSIDCEGMDLRILTTLNLELYPFDIIQVEPGEPLTPKNLEHMERSLRDRGYALMALTEVNAFFVNRSKFKIN